MKLARNKLRTLHSWAGEHRTLMLRSALAVMGLFLIVQIFYPGSSMPLFASVDGQAVGGWSKKDVVARLDKKAATQKLAVSLTSSDQVAGRPLPKDIGITVSNKKRVDAAGYPWYVRVIPTSILWFGLIQPEKAPDYVVNKQTASTYLESLVGVNCTIPPVDATAKLTSGSLQVVPSKAGGTCKKADALAVLTSAKPKIGTATVVKLPVTTVKPAVSDATAEAVIKKLNTETSAGVRLKVKDKEQKIEQREVLSWLSFAPSGSELKYSIDPSKADAYFTKTITPQIAKPAGVTKVSTLDFTETSRSTGVTGETLAAQPTIDSITKVLQGQDEIATVSVVAVQPKTQYSRNYTRSSRGISALLTQYDEDNPGVFGVSFSELGGQRLSAQYNGNRQFVTASTYKLFVAFSTLRRVDAGQMKWDDANIASGRNLSTCFDDMIVKSDNACAEALLSKIGRKELDADIKLLGLTSSTFQSSNNLTTANDLASYLTKLETGSMPIKPESKARLLSAMKRNVYRQGIPTGASGQVADKVGFLWRLLHDAAIVYSPKGTYILTVMSDGSSWGGIADLTRKIESLR